MRELNHFYKENKPFWEIEDSWDGFEWINADDRDRSVISFVRRGKKKTDEVIVICNFTPVLYEKYVVGVPRSGTYAPVLSSDSSKFGGSGRKIKPTAAKKKPQNTMPYSITLDIPPMSAVYLRRIQVKKSK